MDEFAQNLGIAVGKRVGKALAEEIHDDPQTRQAAALGAGAGLGIILGLALFEW